MLLNKKIKKNIVIYTAVFGAKDNLIDPKCVPKNVDFICFTDQDFKSDVWQIKKVKPIFDDSVRSARIYKVLPHKFLSEYEYCVWVDGNIQVKRDVNSLIKRYLKDCNFASYDHTKTKDSRDCIYDEANILIDAARNKKTYKDSPELIKKQMAKYKALHYPAHNGLISSMIVIRRHNEKDVIKTMECWWKEIENNSRRDQLSFNFAAWKNNFKFSYLRGDSRNNFFFKHFNHKSRENYR